jgi:hypothetical protein
MNKPPTELTQPTRARVRQDVRGYIAKHKMLTLSTLPREEGYTESAFVEGGQYMQDRTCNIGGA